MIKNKIKNINNIIVFVILICSIYLIGQIYVNINPPNFFKNEVILLKYTDIIPIFIYNSIIIFIYIFLSYFGGSFLLIFKFIYNMSISFNGYNMSPGSYYLSSYLHGVLELILCYYIFNFSIDLIKGYYTFFKNNNSEYLKNINKQFYIYVLPKMLVIILIAACVEVIISNKLIYYLGVVQ